LKLALVVARAQELEQALVVARVAPRVGLVPWEENSQGRSGWYQVTRGFGRVVVFPPAREAAMVPADWGHSSPPKLSPV